MSNMNKINSREDFLVFMRLLKKDFKNNPSEWENNTLELYLEGIESWIEDMDGYYINANLLKPENIDWQFLANVFMSAKIYE